MLFDHLHMPCNIKIVAWQIDQKELLEINTMYNKKICLLPSHISAFVMSIIHHKILIFDITAFSWGYQSEFLQGIYFCVISFLSL